MKRFAIILITCISTLLASAQHPGGKFNPEEFKAKLEIFVSEKAGFTQAEAQAFYPVYHEMKGKQRELQRQMFALKKEAPADDASENDYAAKIQKIKDLGVEMAQLEVTYYKKLCKVVSPSKVYKAMIAEDKFHRKMLENFNRGKNSRQEHQHK